MALHYSARPRRAVLRFAHRLTVGADSPEVVAKPPERYAKPLGCYALPLAVACLTAGCRPSDRPPLGRVEGTVTLDGAPLPAALVVFTPRGPGRSSRGTTDAAGRYELSYLRDILGANRGGHDVQITTSEDGIGRERLPVRYHAQSELRAEVEAGSNTIDFPLESR